MNALNYCYKSKRIRPTSRHISLPSKTGLTPQTTSWERGSHLVKNTDISNQYLEHIREVHDPSLHLKTIEEELLGTMGKALGKQGEKIKVALHKMKNEKESFDRIISELDSSNVISDLTSLPLSTRQELVTIISNYNKFRKEALHARWELIVHRQAVGFTVGNHHSVTDKFPIPEAWDLPKGFTSDLIRDSSSSAKKTVRSTYSESLKRNFDGEMNWWKKFRGE